MDEFSAQSRVDDDLFGDDIEYVQDEDITIEIPEIQLSLNQTRQVPPQVQAQSQASGQGRGQGQGQAQDRKEERRQGGGERGRGQGGRGGQGGGRGTNVPNGGLNASRYSEHPVPAPVPISAPAPVSTTYVPESKPSTTTLPTDKIPDALPQSSTISSEVPVAQSPSPPLVSPPRPEPQPHRIAAVRGDRSATGGPAHKKLTEAELTEKMAKMAIINAQKAERHRLSEADQAAFQNREKELAKERKEKAVAERQNQRQQEMERAKNRERKIKAQTAREWDSEKVDSDIVDGKGRGRSSEYVRGGHGGVIRGGGMAGSRYATDENDASYNSGPARGRGGFEGRGRGGARGGRGGGRGGRGGSSNTVPTAEDFPALPIPSTNVVQPTPLTAEALNAISDHPAANWAEEMETPIAEKNEKSLW